MSDQAWPTFGRPPRGMAESWELEGELRQLSPGELRRLVHLLTGRIELLSAQAEAKVWPERTGPT